MRKYVLCLLLCLSALMPGVAMGDSFDALKNEEYIQDYRTIPGVSQADIDAIDALRETRDHFVYGTLQYSEAFAYADGTRAGFSVALCEMLSEMFDIPFVQEFRTWDALYDDVLSGAVDFTGELTASEARQPYLTMSAPIHERTVKVFTNRHAADLRTIAEDRTLRIAALEGAITGEQVMAVSDLPIELVYVASHEAAADQLEYRLVDAFVEEAPGAHFLDGKDFIAVQDFFPLICSPVSVATARTELIPVIRVLDQYLAHGGAQYLAQLYAEGDRAYMRYQLVEMRLDDTERAALEEILAREAAVPVALVHDNYPVSFYNETERTFEGIAVDVLQAVEELTGMRFEIVSPADETKATLMQRLDRGEAAVLAGVPRRQTQEGEAIWHETAFTTDYFALLGRAESADITIAQIPLYTVGLIQDSVYSDVFRQWFPTDQNVQVFVSSEEAFTALKVGKIDYLMGSENLLLHQLNYREEPEYKTCIVFNYPLTFRFGFGTGEAQLQAIMKKALALVDTQAITSEWKHRVYDYRDRLMKDLMPFLLMFMAVLVVLFVVQLLLLRKNTRLGRSLEETVRQRTRELAEKTSTLEAVFSAIPDLIFCKDVDGVFTECNSAFERHMHKSKAEILGKTDRTLLDLPEEINDAYMDDDQEAIRTRSIMVKEEMIYSAHHGAGRLFETIKSPLFRGDEVVGVMGIARDITERKAIEAAAQVASQAKSEFLARMSHEIRTPLNAIIGMTHIARGSVTNPEKTLSAIDEITTASTHLLGILNDVLDMSKIESGKFEIAHDAFELRGAMGEVSSIVSQRSKEKFISFHTNLDALPEVYLLGDKLRLNQVLINLLGNAVKFTPVEGRIDFTVDVLDRTAASVTLRFTVRDNGIGMTPEQMQRLFVAFEQADTSISARFGGTGLGLAISQNLVGLMGGTITVESAQGSGSAFQFTLTFDAAGDQTRQQAVEIVGTLDLTGKHVLLVEDVEINRVILQEILADTRLQMDEAMDGQQAVEAFAASQVGHYDLILMDIQMPVMDGYEATRAIRALNRPDAATVPIIAMTANAYQEDIHRALAVGMNGHLSKPIDLDVVLRTLAQVLRG